MPTPRTRDERLRAKQEEALTALASGRPVRLELRRAATYNADPEALVLQAYLETDAGRYRSNPDFELISRPGTHDTYALLGAFADLLKQFTQYGPAPLASHADQVADPFDKLAPEPA